MSKVYTCECEPSYSILLITTTEMNSMANFSFNIFSFFLNVALDMIWGNLPKQKFASAKINLNFTSFPSPLCIYKTCS